MTTQPTTNLSPWDTAMNPPEQTSEWFGQMTVAPYYVSLVPDPTSATGKKTRMPWDPNVLDANGQLYRRYTYIELTLTPISDRPMENIERGLYAEFGDWPEHVLPSLKEIGVTNLQALNGAWVRFEFAKTGRTYTNGNGETKEGTAMKFTAVYADEAACRAAYQANRGNNGAAAPASAQPQTPPWTAPTNGNGNGNSAERVTAEKFLKPYVQNAWRQSGKDLDKARQILATAIANQNLLAKYFTVDSQEVIDLLMTESLA